MMRERPPNRALMAVSSSNGTPIVLINGETAELCFAMRRPRILGEQTMDQEKNTQQWEEAWRRHFRTCPQCGQVWLVFGLRENEAYTCRTCHHRFIILHSYCSDAPALQGQKKHQPRSNQTEMQEILSADLCEAEGTGRGG
jgi:hypothetical protein